jgi:hypothetical protein
MRLNAQIIYTYTSVNRTYSLILLIRPNIHVADLIVCCDIPLTPNPKDHVYTLRSGDNIKVRLCAPTSMKTATQNDVQTRE